MNKYKTFEELKEELGNKFDVFMYGANMNLLEQLETYENMRKEAINYINKEVAVYAFNNKNLPHWEFNDENITINN